MKSFLTNCLLFALLQLAIGGFLVFKAMGPATNEGSFFAAVLDKQEMLADTSKPRLILVGGSNVAFGFDSKELGEALELEPVNVGLHAGLGLYIPLNQVEAQVRAGDTVILAFEYELIGRKLDGDPMVIEKVFGYWPGGRRYANTTVDWKRFLDHEGLDRFHQLVKEGKKRLDNKEPRSRSHVYWRNSFNEFGDLTAHHGKPSPGLGKYGMPICLNRKGYSPAIKRINQFHANCVEKGAQVYFSYPPVPADLYSQCDQVLAKIDDQMRSGLTVPIINSPEEMVFPKSEFFDSQYHLGQDAAELRSKNLVKSIVDFQSRIANVEAEMR